MARPLSQGVKGVRGDPAVRGKPGPEVSAGSLLFNSTRLIHMTLLVSTIDFQGDRGQEGVIGVPGPPGRKVSVPQLCLCLLGLT